MTFTIDNENNITAHVTPEEAVAVTATPFDSFSSQRELAELAKAWPAERLVAVWNSLPGVPSAKKFKDHKTAIRRIWERIQGLGESAEPQAEQPAKLKAKGGAHAAKGAPAKAKASRRATPAHNAPKSKKATKGQGAAAPRAGTKLAQVVCMLQRKKGATLVEIMESMGWQRHYADVRIMPTCIGNPVCRAGIAAMESA